MASMSDVGKWLKIVEEKENVKDLKIDIVGSSGKGDGYGSSIMFVKAVGLSDDGSQKDYHFAIKYNKANQMVHDIFSCETFIYEKVFPAFKQFQIERDIEHPFESVPKFYGGFSSASEDVIILENMKKSGYDLWSNMKPWKRKNIDLVVREYGKLHAISLAMKEQKPETFQTLIDKLNNNVGKVFEKTGMTVVIENIVEELGGLLKNSLSQQILEKWSKVKQQVKYIYTDLIQNVEDFKVIIHGDCWSNNFLLKLEDEESLVASQFAMLDWQLSTFSSPVLDLSYFLFSCTSKEDFGTLDGFLKSYYTSFSNHVKLLGSNSDLVYPENQFLKDWKKYSKFGIVMCLLPLKLSHVEKDDTPDMIKAAENHDNDVAAIFSVEVKKNKDVFRNRVLGIVEYAVQNELV